MEIGVKECFMRILVRSKSKWAGHVDRMGDGKVEWETGRG